MNLRFADYDIEQFTWSIATKRTQDEIANSIEAFKPADLKGARKVSVPAHLEPMLATLVTKPPDRLAVVLRN